MYRLVLYYDKDVAYASKIRVLTDLLEKVNRKWGVDYRVVEAEKLSTSQVERLKEDIRNTMLSLEEKLSVQEATSCPYREVKIPI